MLGFIKRCGGTHFFHKWWDSWGNQARDGWAMHPCYLFKNCERCGKRKETEIHHWRKVPDYMEQISAGHQGYIEPQDKFQCADCPAWYIRIYCDR